MLFFSYLLVMEKQHGKNLHPQPALRTSRRGEVVEMVVPPGNHPAVPRDWTRGARFSMSQGELVLSLFKEHPRTPGFRLFKTGRRRRQGGLRRKAHPEPLPSFADRKASRALHQNTAERPGLALRKFEPRDGGTKCEARNNMEIRMTETPG
jgi:hypothetical protein